MFGNAWSATAFTSNWVMAWPGLNRRAMAALRFGRSPARASARAWWCWRLAFARSRNGRGTQDWNLANVAADAICGRGSQFRGVQATAVCGFFGMTVALTGASEKTLRRAGVADVDSVYLHPGHHVAYYPGAKPIHLKLVFRRSDGLVLGAQAVGEEGVERRIDVISTAIQNGATVFDLEEAELCYAPQFGAAKDPVNVAGMIAANVVRGDADLAPWSELPNTDAFLLDVREPSEYQNGNIAGAANTPLGELRARLGELPRDREIWVHCGVGQRAYYACRVLTQRGFRCRNFSGGYQTYLVQYPNGHVRPKEA
jgi:rhodanese-related sulfurtransferase